MEGTSLLIISNNWFLIKTIVTPAGPRFFWAPAYIKSEGLDSIEKKNSEKSKLIYDEIDRNKCFIGFSDNNDRSHMNATFNLADGYDADLFKSICSDNHISGINGHRSVGGFRASIYNALDIESVKTLITCMKEFESNYN